MYWQTRHRTNFRIIALAMLAFCVLSNARGLVPGMCATLAAAKSGEAQASCCATQCSPQAKETGADREMRPNGDKHPACAFCHLVKGFIDVQSYVYCDHPASVAELSNPGSVEEFLSTESRHSARPRDPPVFPIFS
ncbi:MAG: hypothetical protein SGI88_09320 [Candidatus Hydrogenedentes bacterium]|nr:hypothetical protein [Candidatus Hydrogenedentota bacterium]